MTTAHNFHEQTTNITKELFLWLKKLIDSLELGNICEEGENFMIQTAIRSLIQTIENLLELIKEIKLHAIISTPSLEYEENQLRDQNHAEILIKNVKAYLIGFS